VDASKHLIPFWEETLTTVLDLTNGEIYDVFDRDTQTQFAIHRTWWNSNLTMDKFMPTFMPVHDERDQADVNVLYERFADRFLQRNLTHKTPLRPGVLLTHGLVVSRESDDTKCGAFVKVDGDRFVYMQFINDLANRDFDKDPHCAPDFSDPERTLIVRLAGYSYWNGVGHV